MGVGWLSGLSPYLNEESYFSFAGPLETKGKTSWQVAGVNLVVDKHTQLGDAIPIGELVLAIFQVQPNGSRLALQIQAVSALEKERTPTATPTATPTPTSTTGPTIEQPRGQIQNLAPDKGSSSQSGMVTVCHKPNKKKGGKTQVVELSALNGHLKHGDTLGACH